MKIAIPKNFSKNFAKRKFKISRTLISAKSCSPTLTSFLLLTEVNFRGEFYYIRHSSYKKNPVNLVSEILEQDLELSLREKCPHSEFFSSVFSRIPTECSFPIQSKCGKMRTRKTAKIDTFYVVFNYM